MHLETVNQIKELCISNARELLSGSLLLLKQGLEHLSFHLSVMALEEIGKITIVSIGEIKRQRKSDDDSRIEIEDHEKKLFWAIWGPSFGMVKISSAQIEEHRSMAKSLHKKRKDYLYTSLENPVSWRDKMESGEAKRLYDFVSKRIELEDCKGKLTSLDTAGDESFKWFIEITNDPQKRKEIFSRKSQEKLIEIGNVKEWVNWLKGVYDKNEEEMRAIMNEELQRKLTDSSTAKPKWKIKIKIITPSHSIRNKSFERFNTHSETIKLNRIDVHSFYVNFTAYDNLATGMLWEYGWGLARLLVAALNIATRGFFWWNVPLDTSKYYEEIWDIEKNVGVGIEMTPKLEVDWKKMRWALRDSDMVFATLIFNYLTHLRSKNSDALNYYVHGLSLLAKNDVHLRLEISAFEYFYKSLKNVLIENKDWDEKGDISSALFDRVKWIYNGPPDHIESTISLGSEVEREHKSDQAITLTEVIAIKSYCDIYFMTLAKDYAEKQAGHKINFTLSSPTDKD